MSTPIAQNVYPKDLTMSLESNHIQREQKTFNSVEERMFVPDGGPFFSQSLILKDNNGILLKPNVDFKLLHLNEEASIESGRDVLAIIWILKESVPSVFLDYRVVGGEYGNTVNAILQIINNINSGGPGNGNAGERVDWNINVYGKPEQFPTAPHYHTPETFTGWSTVYSQLDGIRKAIIVGDDASWESHYNYINRKTNAIELNLADKLDNYTTKEYVNGLTFGTDVKIDLTGYYTKLEVDAKIKVSNTSSGQIANALGDYYTKFETDERYAILSSSYTKLESDTKYAISANYYTSDVSDGRYLTKGALDGYASNVRVNDIEASIPQQIASAVTGGKVDLSSYYSKAQSDAKYATQVNTYSRSELLTKSAVEGKFTEVTQLITATSLKVSEFENKLTTHTNVTATPDPHAQYITKTAYQTTISDLLARIEVMEKKKESPELLSYVSELFQQPIDVIPGIRTASQGWNWRKPTSLDSLKLAKNLKTSPTVTKPPGPEPSPRRVNIQVPAEYDPAIHTIVQIYKEDKYCKVVSGLPAVKDGTIVFELLPRWNYYKEYQYDEGGRNYWNEYVDFRFEYVILGTS